MIRIYFNFILAILIFIIISITLTVSLNMPYETDDTFKEFLIYSVYISVITFWFYICLVYKPNGMDTTLFIKKFSESRKIQKIETVFVAVLFPLMIAWACAGFFLYSAGIPTYFFADQEVKILLECKHLNQRGRIQGRQTLIEAVDNKTGDEWDILWPSDNLPECPGIIYVEGRRWGLGAYVTDVR